MRLSPLIDSFADELAKIASDRGKEKKAGAAATGAVTGGLIGGGLTGGIRGALAGAAVGAVTSKGSSVYNKTIDSVGHKRVHMAQIPTTYDDGYTPTWKKMQDPRYEGTRR